MTNEHYEIIMAVLAEKIKELGHELGYVKLQKDFLERKLDEIEEGVKQDGTANIQ